MTSFIRRAERYYQATQPHWTLKIEYSRYLTDCIQSSRGQVVLVGISFSGYCHRTLTEVRGEIVMDLSESDSER